MSSPSAVAAQPGTRELTLSQAVNEALAEEMRRDDRVYCIGEDIVLGVPFGCTKGLIDEFGPARVLNAPITYFYEGLGDATPRPATPHQRMLLEIARNFSEIQNERHQEAVSQLARALAGR